MKLIWIKTYATRSEADIAKGLLESYGIKTILEAFDRGVGVALQGGTGETKLLIREEDEKKARAVLEEKD